MHIVTKSIGQAIMDENWFAALYMSLTLPGVCGSIEYSVDDESKKYARWFDENLGAKYKGLLSGGDCFLLQQACLCKDLSHQHLTAIERFQFVFPKNNSTLSSHMSMIDGILQLEIDKFCNDMVASFERWMDKVNDSIQVQRKLEHLTEVTLKLVKL